MQESWKLPRKRKISPRNRSRLWEFRSSPFLFIIVFISIFSVTLHRKTVRDAPTAIADCSPGLLWSFFPRYGRNDEIVAQTSSNLHWKQNLKQTFQYRTILPIVRRNNNLTDTQKYRRIAAGRVRCAVQTYQDTTFRERERKKVCHIDKLNFLVFR